MHGMTALSRHFFGRNARRRALGVVPLALALALLLPAVCAAPAAADVAAAVSTSLAKRTIPAAGAGIFIWDLDTGRTVYAANADVRFVPASNLKLATTAAVLNQWGPDYRFTSALLMTNTRVVEGVLPGDLYLRGGGDPSLSTEAYQAARLGFTTASVDAFVRSVRALGIAKIEGAVVGDESRFDAERTVASWRPGIETVNCGPLSALTVNQGLAAGKRVPDPAVHAAASLTRALRKSGIAVTGKPRRGRVPATARLIQEQSSAPLATLLQHMNKMSDNFFAETLTKSLGVASAGDGSTADGVTVSAAALTAMDIPARAYAIYDGSGLSYLDQLTPHGIVRLLGTMAQRPDFAVFYNSLAVAGTDGTLAARMRKTAAAGNARAKTGTLNVATGLSGYVTSANGHLLAFSILIACTPATWPRANQVQDDIVAALAAERIKGKRVLRVATTLRQRPASDVHPVHTTGRALQALVQP